jgi:hypothetical protein
MDQFFYFSFKAYHLLPSTVSHTSPMPKDAISVRPQVVVGVHDDPAILALNYPTSIVQQYPHVLAGDLLERPWLHGEWLFDRDYVWFLGHGATGPSSPHMARASS